MKNKEKVLISKPFLSAAICSIVYIFFAILQNILITLFPLSPINGFYSLLGFFISLPVYYAFFLIGKKYDNTLLKVLSILAVVFSALFMFGSSFVDVTNTSYLSELNQTIFEANNSFYALNSTGNLTTEQLEVLNNEIQSKILFTILPVIIFFGIIAILFLIYCIFWGIALIKLDKKVKYAKLAGILTIVGAATSLIFIGIFLLFVAAILEIVILFNLAKKFKELK